MAVAAGEVQSLDDRRKPLALTNPLLAKESVLLPEPNVESVTYEHLSLNLPSIAVNALDAVSRITVEEENMPSIPEEDGEMIPELPDEDMPEIPADEETEIPDIPTEEDNNNE